jgi:hypothetical protein
MVAEYIVESPIKYEKVWIFMFDVANKNKLKLRYIGGF